VKRGALLIAQMNVYYKKYVVVEKVTHTKTVRGNQRFEVQVVDTSMPESNRVPSIYKVEAEPRDGYCEVISVVKYDGFFYNVPYAKIARALKRHAGKLERDYSRNGGDNNYLRYDFVDGEHPAMKKKVGKDKVELKNFKVVAKGVAQCALMQAGAYGEHIDKWKQRRLARKFTKKLFRLKKSRDLKFYRLNDYILEDDIFNSNCTFMVDYGRGTRALLIDSHGYD